MTRLAISTNSRKRALSCRTRKEGAVLQSRTNFWTVEQEKIHCLGEVEVVSRETISKGLLNCINFHFKLHISMENNAHEKDSKRNGATETSRWLERYRYGFVRTTVSECID